MTTIQTLTAGNLACVGERTALKFLAEVRLMVEPAHRAALDELPAELRHIAGYHAGWWEADGQPSRPRDKGIRPALALASAAAIPGGTAAMAVPAAVAVQLIHDFTLLHDDIMDGDRIRRHRPTAWSTFGVGAAILTGDALHALAMQLLSESMATRKQLKVLLSGIGELCRGQSADLCFERSPAVSVQECLTMVAGKTGALLGCACEMGAMAGGADRHRAAAARSFGRSLGIAFQLTDDVLGIWGDPAATGKPVYADLARRKKSLPVVKALTSGTDAGQALAELYAREEALSEDEIMLAADLVDAAGGHVWALAEAQSLLREALCSMKEVPMNRSGVDDLERIARLVVLRHRWPNRRSQPLRSGSTRCDLA
jgi:geranylgeranyl diphosphate synthase, type I